MSFASPSMKESEPLLRCLRVIVQTASAAHLSPHRHRPAVADNGMVRAIATGIPSAAECRAAGKRKAGAAERRASASSRQRVETVQVQRSAAYATAGVTRES